MGGLRQKAAGIAGFLGAALALGVGLEGLDPLWLAPALGFLLLGFRLPGSPLQGIGLAVALAGGTVLAEEGHRGLGAAVGAMPFLQALERALVKGVKGEPAKNSR